MRKRIVFALISCILCSAALAGGPYHHHYSSHSLHSEDWARIGIGALTTILSSAVTPPPVVVTGETIVQPSPVVVMPAYTPPEPVVVVPSQVAVQPVPVAVTQTPVVVVPSATVYSRYYRPSRAVIVPPVAHPLPDGRYYYRRPAPPPGCHYYRPPAYPHRRRR